MKQPTPYMLALVVSVAFIEGCASLHPSLYARGDQDATIIVYIEGLFSQVPEGMQPSAVVSLDGVNIVKLLRGEYAQINCPPGTHQLAVFEDGTMGERLISFDVDAKERRYFRISINPSRRIAVFCPPLILLGLIQTFDIEEVCETEVDSANMLPSYHEKKIKYSSTSNKKDGHGP